MRGFPAELADTVARIFHETEQTNIDAETIVSEHFKGFKLSPGFVREVIKALPRVKLYLERRHGIQSCLLSEDFNGVEPKSLGEARRCIAGCGHRRPAAGIHIVSGSRDLLYQAALQKSTASGAGMVHKNLDRNILAGVAGHFTDQQVVTIAEGVKKKIAPAEWLASLPNQYRKAIESTAPSDAMIGAVQSVTKKLAKQRKAEEKHSIQ